MKRTACLAACVGAAVCLLGAGGGSAGCGGGTLGGNGGGAPLTGAGGRIDPGSGAAGSVSQGSAGDFGPGVGGDIAPPPRGGAGGMAGVLGTAGRIGPLGGRAGTGGVGGAGGMVSCPPTTSPVCGSACGNGVVDTCLRMVSRDCHPAYVTEDCDGADFGPRTCQSLGYVTGDLACSPTCTLDYGACSACAAPDAFVASCGDAPVLLASISSVGLAASEDQVAVAFVNSDSSNGASRVTFAQMTPELALLYTRTLDDNSLPGPVYGLGLYQAAIAPIGPGWVVAVCSDDDLYFHLIDANGRDVARTVVAHARDPIMACQAGTLSLAAQPSGGPLLLWQTSEGLSASLIADNGQSAGAPLTIVGPEAFVFGSSVAWIGGAFQIAAAVAPGPAGGEAIRLVTVQTDGTAALVADVDVSAVDAAPRIAAGASDLRIVYAGVPAGAPVGFGLIWQRFGASGQPILPPAVLASYPDYFGQAPAVALGDDTFVLFNGYAGAELAIERVGLDGSVVTPLRDLVKMPASAVAFYDMVRRGPDLIVGWLSPATGAFQLARLTP